MPDDLNLRLATLSALLELNEAVSEDDLKAAQDCRAVSRQTKRLPKAFSSVCSQLSWCRAKKVRRSSSEAGRATAIFTLDGVAAFPLGGCG
jgi:nitrogen fixation/metabolism regulation signal transduction histidine kinase